LQGRPASQRQQHTEAKQLKLPKTVLTLFFNASNFAEGSRNSETIFEAIDFPLISFILSLFLFKRLAF